MPLASFASLPAPALLIVLLFIVGPAILTIQLTKGEMRARRRRRQLRLLRGEPDPEPAVAIRARQPADDGTPRFRVIGPSTPTYLTSSARCRICRLPFRPLDDLDLSQGIQRVAHAECAESARRTGVES